MGKIATYIEPSRSAPNVKATDLTAASPSGAFLRDDGTWAAPTATADWNTLANKPTLGAAAAENV